MLGITVPVIPGVMPLQTYAMFTRMTNLCGATVPSHIQTTLDDIKVQCILIQGGISFKAHSSLKHDDQLVKEYGVKLAVSMIRSILSDGDVKGVHFCTLNLEKSVRRILDELHWTNAPTHATNQLITVRFFPSFSDKLVVTNSLHRTQHLLHTFFLPRPTPSTQ